MQPSSSTGTKDNATTQGTKRSLPDEHPEVVNKAARLETTTNENNMRPGNQVDGDSQSANAVQERYLPPMQNLVPEVPTTHQSLALPPLNNNPGPVRTYASPQPPYGVQQPGGNASSRQSIPHHQNMSHTDVPGNMDRVQASTYGNAIQGGKPIQVGKPIHQSNPNVQSAAQMDRLRPQPTPTNPSSFDERLFSHVIQSIVSLSIPKVITLLAAAALKNPETLSNIRDAVSQQQDAERQNGSSVLDYLVVQRLHDNNTMGMLPPAQANQYPTPQYPPPPYTQAPYPPPQHPQPGPGQDAREENENDESDEDEVLSFDDSKDDVSYILFVEYADLRDSQQVDITRDAVDDIENVIQRIADAVRPNSHYVTKNRAMCALRNIGMMVAEADGFLGNKVKNHMAYDSVLIKAFRSLYNSMTETERKNISLDYMEDLERLDKERDICFEGFDDIVKLFREARRQT
jgi:hypothetical protein